jgi:DDE superfamily endonuclease
VVARARVGPAGWSAGIDELTDRIAGRFARIECRRRVRGFLLGLLADLPRKNCLTIAEHAGDATPDGMQHLLARAVWDTDGVRDDLRDYVVDHLGDPAAVLVVDETGDVKKGMHTVGVQRGVHRHRWASRELPGRCLPDLLRRAWARADRSGAVPAEVLDRRSGPLRADALAAALPRRAWQRLSAGPGAKGQRYYDWACLDLPVPDRATDTGCWWLLIRRSRRTGELAFYRCYHPAPVRLIQLVTVAGRRWTVEESFQGGKGLVGLDEHQVRRWLPWQRWTLLAMLAHALLVVLAAGEHATAAPPVGLIPLTCNELQRLLLRLVLEPARRPADPETWSRWRRRHQYRARISHYHCQSADLS